MEQLDYQKAKDYFYGKKNHYWDLGLDNIKLFLARLESPQEKLRIVQIAGTNGKGSVCAYLSSILKASGYNVGRYNSPVVFDELENICINDIPISKEEFSKQVELMKDAIEASEKENRLPTIFELETAMAINYFAYKKCDIVVLETGLGGRDDATNVSSKSLLSIITSISMDHMEYLGNTIEEIASVKGGIIKRNCPVIIQNQDEKVLNIIKETAYNLNSKLFISNKEDAIIKKESLEGQVFDYKDFIKDIKINLLGRYQIENALLAIEAANILKNELKSIDEKAIKLGLESTVWRGRFDVISKEPLIIIDGAHNPDAAMRLAENMDIYLKNYKKIFILGIFADKDYKEIIRITLPYAEEIITVTSLNKRALDAKTLRRVIEEMEYSCNKDIRIIDATDITKAVELAKESANKIENTAIIAFGSLSFLKEIK